MVAIRRVKRLIQFSVLAVFLATLLLFLQWNEISDSEKFNTVKRGETSLDVDNRGLTDPEREFDVNEILKDIHGNNDAGEYREDDWKTAFNEKAKHQVEKKNQFHNNWRETAVRANIDHVDKRKLKQLMPNESQISNFTTASTITDHNVKVQVLSTTLPTVAVAKDKNKGSSKHNAEIHEKTFRADHGHHVQNNHTWKKFPWTKEMLGVLNVHIWQAWCGSTIHDLRRNRFFPLYPDVRLTIKKFFLRHVQNDYGQRIFGYVHPPVSGRYTFAISSDDSSELWLSSDESPSKVKLIAWVGNRTLLSGTLKTKIAQFTKYKTQLSRPVFLHKGQKYFIEALHKQAHLEDHVLVGWKIPGLNNFRHLTGSSISALIDEVKAPKDVTAYADFIPQDLPSHSHHRTSSIILDPNVFKFGSDDLRDRAHMDRFVDERDIEKLFPSCPYNPSYLVDFKLRRYEGVMLIHDTALYPDDHSELTHMKQYDQCMRRRIKDSHGNQVGTLPPKLKFNYSLYESGSITVFRNGKAFLPLSFAKSAEEKEQAEEQLLETQMDLRDIKRLSQEVEDSTQSSTKAHPTEMAHFSPKHDQESTFEMKKKTKRKDIASVKRTERSTQKKEEPPEKRKDKSRDKTRRKSPLQDSRVDSKKTNSRDSETGAPDRSRDQASRDSMTRQSNGYESSRGTQRKLLSYDTNDRRSPNNTMEPAHGTGSDRVNAPRVSHNNPRTSRSNDNLEPNKANFFGYNMYNSLPQKGRNTSYSNLPQRRGRIQFYPIDKQDDQMTRMNAAREFVRKMIYAVQMYNHRVNSRTLTDAVYRKFGVKMKIPNIVRVPEYDSWIFHQNSTKCASDGNLLLNANVAKSVVNRYMRALKKASNNKYSLKDIVNVEENHDVMKGDRYLIDLELNVEGKNSSVRLSQYIYQKIGSTEFCLPQGFVLNQHATVHIIIPVKNQGKWVKHFIDNMVELYSETGDPHVNIIIVDFSSTDIDVNAVLKRSQLKRYQVKTLKGAFQRAYGIQAGASLVKNPRDIIFMCDLHLQIPSNIVDIIRKHCVQGKMAFAPIVARLHCGFSPSLPFGFWELQGYGLFAMYKSDFTRVGGMNYKEFRTTWGGEDWELLDRVLLYKMEVERLRVPKFYHYYHSKKGMWGTRSMFNSQGRDLFGRFDDNSDVITLYNETKEREEQKRFVFYKQYYSSER